MDRAEEVFIIGEFNNWQPEAMKKIAESEPPLFEYEKQVQKGFKYRYQFLINDQTVIDFSSDYSESRTGRLTNHIYAGNA